MGSHRRRFDVWLGNARGNGYSMLNLNYSVSDKQFWAFSYGPRFFLGGGEGVSLRVVCGEVFRGRRNNL